MQPGLGTRIHAQFSGGKKSFVHVVRRVRRNELQIGCPVPRRCVVLCQKWLHGTVRDGILDAHTLGVQGFESIKGSNHFNAAVKIVAMNPTCLSCSFKALPVT